MLVRSFAAALSYLAFATLAVAQTPAPAAPPPPPPQNIPKATSGIELDGALGDAAWQNAAVFDKFYETSPGDNIPAKVRTVAYITYDARYFYIGIRADDPEPKKIRAPFVERDGVIGTDDNIAIFLDTRNDRRSAIELRVNPRGIQADGIFNDANGNEDFSPDFYYDTAAQITSEGWTAEFRIPFSSFRYSGGDPQTWNILVWRNYPRDFRYAFHSAPLPRGASCLVCFTHPITGLTGLPEAAHFVAAPYVTAQQVSRPEGELGTNLEGGDFNTDAGLDVKWNPSQNHTVDFTFNPDFSQIEADVPQILVNQRFAVFFPEKRPFFLEGFDLFDTPLQVAYTRTIASPRAGARATGKIGSTAYTFLTTKDEGGAYTIIPGPTRSDFALLDMKSYATIGRVRHDLGDSFVGAVLTDREIDGGGHNRVIGPDFQWRPNDTNTFTAQLLYSDTENPLRPDLSRHWNGESASSHALRARWDHRTRTNDYGVEVNDIGDAFRADLGFLPQVGYRELVGYYGRSYYPEGKVRFVRPSIVVDRQQARGGDTIYDLVSAGVNGFGAKNTQFSALLRGERIRVGGELLSQNYVQLFYQFDPYRRIPRITLQARLGDQIDFDNAREGEGLSLSATMTARPHDRLDLQFFVARDTLDVDGGRLFTATIERMRAQYSFSAKSLVRVIAQYVVNDYDPALYTRVPFPIPEKDGAFLGSVLYSYKINWQTVLFVGYGDDRVLLEDDRLPRVGRSLFLKVSYAFIK
jgi:hypothetical protein